MSNYRTELKKESKIMTMGESNYLNRPSILRKLFKTHLSQFASMAEYLVSILTATRKLEAMKKPLDDECVAVLMLNGLPEDFEPFVVGIEDSDAVVSSDSIKTKLLLESDRVQWNYGLHTINQTVVRPKSMRGKRRGRPASERVKTRKKIGQGGKPNKKRHLEEFDDEGSESDGGPLLDSLHRIGEVTKLEKEHSPWNKPMPEDCSLEAAGGDAFSDSPFNTGPSSDVTGLVGNAVDPLDTSPPFQCNLCQEQFDSRSLVFDHLKQNHKNETPFSCPICRNLFNDQAQMKVHYLSHRYEKDFPCPVCQIRLATKGSLAHHLKTHDRGNETHDCTECGRSFQRSADLKSHIKMHARKDEMRCRECGDRFEDKDLLESHVERHENEKRHVCHFCDKRFKATGSLKCHLRTHTGEKPFACDRCPKKFRVKYQLAGHLVVAHGDNSLIDEKRLTCQHCFKVCASINNLQAHLRSHAVARHYQCTQCNMGFKHSSNLKEHFIRKHTNDFNFECDICKKRTKTKGALVSHIGMHHGVKRSSDAANVGCLCPICGNHIKNKHRLPAHLKVHSPERPFLCNQCGQTFKYKAVLKDHQIIHSSERPFKCTMCEKAYKHNSLLTAHIRTHTGEAPYVCETCGRAFRTPKNLKVHIRTHTGESPYGCALCGKCFKNRSNYTSHMKTHRIPP